MKKNPDMATWRELLTEAMEYHSESWDDVVKVVFGQVHTHYMDDDKPEEASLDREFDDGYGTAEGGPFTLWTQDRVYFPTEYDGSESVGSVPRNPCDVPTGHW